MKTSKTSLKIQSLSRFIPLPVQKYSVEEVFEASLVQVFNIWGWKNRAQAEEGRMNVRRHHCLRSVSRLSRWKAWPTESCSAWFVFLERYSSRQVCESCRRTLDRKNSPAFETGGGWGSNPTLLKQLFSLLPKRRYCSHWVGRKNRCSDVLQEVSS